MSFKDRVKFREQHMHVHIQPMLSSRHCSHGRGDVQFPGHVFDAVQNVWGLRQGAIPKLAVVENEMAKERTIQCRILGGKVRGASCPSAAARSPSHDSYFSLDP